jgi:hypothetical protein
MLYQRIGSNRRAMAEVANVSRLCADLVESLVDSTDDSARGVGWGRGNVPHHYWPVFSTNRQMSVNVPPEWAPMRQAIGQ